ncbi:coiled-coil domain-containing protein 25 isoform X2 [Leptonychotes weddellii]|uniref:Coiled-coil domain-containing protein 25 n=1 Tax=Leptonychotes weddellii TaxID=9713 RepID=A0A7F8QYG7_LEPWE|nr:coiled-coil domain-containing protein 25 isoform X2 [Leptonychotes weddellii]
MVFYFTSNSDEDLIKHGWPEDIWFHVDKLSSAHVYLRLHKRTIPDLLSFPVEIMCGSFSHSLTEGGYSQLSGASLGHLKQH